MSSEYLNNKFLEGVILRFKSSKLEIAQFKLILEDLEKSTCNFMAEKYSYKITNEGRDILLIPPR